MVRRSNTGTITSRDRAGISPRFLVLSFTPPTTTGLEYIEVYKRPVAGDSSQDVMVHRERIVDRIPGIYPYYTILIHSEADMIYVVDYLDYSGTRLASRVSTEQYAPPAPVQQEVYVNGPVYVKELVSRDYTVLETKGERAILLRKLTDGLQCHCRRDEERHSTSACKTCYGTGWEGGYRVFYPFLFNFQLAGEQLQLTETAILMNQQPRGWTVIAPEIRDGDFVVRFHNQLLDRFQVTNPTRSVRDGVAAIPTIQEFQVRVHQQGHPIYRFPVEDHVADYTPPTRQSGLPEAGI